MYGIHIGKIYFNSGVDEAIWCIIIACYIIYKTDEIELQALPQKFTACWQQPPFFFN